MNNQHVSEEVFVCPAGGFKEFCECRLTGYSFPPSDCDAYSYRTFSCDILPGMTTETIREFCRMMIVKRGRFADVAEESLRH